MSSLMSSNTMACGKGWLFGSFSITLRNCNSCMGGGREEGGRTRREGVSERWGGREGEWGGREASRQEEREGGKKIEGREMGRETGSEEGNVERETVFYDMLHQATSTSDWLMLPTVAVRLCTRPASPSGTSCMSTWYSCDAMTSCLPGTLLSSLLSSLFQKAYTTKNR